MQVGKQIQHYRKEKNLSQDDLAEIIFVSRQSISNWERGATYPDIQNLLLLSKVFEVSLDKLVKGDLETMKQIIHDQEFMRYQKDGAVFTILLIGSPIIMISLILYLDWFGIAISCLIFAITMFYALRIEKFKKQHNLRTFRQIVAYDQGRSLSEIEEAEERGKAPYQNIILPVLFSLGIGAIALLFSWLLLTFFPIK
ncbi:transcriptional repressor DicA [Streptococcus sanguinis]|uniref:helix-turn-helix domain-containing protein n=1 Tax=Streptococcus sanguinis TaxID=1305 RepID=UPI000F66E204|nr:helix-turn-helix transcriptional regulator [Streptococcus sanguinis]RSI19333.1 transcriptional repressor DicA [Streptococcus sanguinis]